MKKYLFIFFTISTVFLSGCISDIPIDQRIRIVGIIDACKNSPDQMESYLEKKVNNKEISDIVSFTIKECLKTDDNIEYKEVILD